MAGYEGRGGNKAAPEIAAAGRRLNLRADERGCGSEPAHSLMDHSFFSTESTCTSLYRLHRGSKRGEHRNGDAQDCGG